MPQKKTTGKKPTPRLASRFASILTEEEKAFVHMAMKDGVQKAASAMGLDAARMASFLRSKTVQNYIAIYQNHWMRTMAAYELSRVSRYPVTRDDVVGRLLALAYTSPEETRGTIDGQVGALSAIADLLGMKFNARDADRFFEGKTPDQLDNFARYGKFDPSPEEKASVDHALQSKSSESAE